jgi:flagellin-like protein
VKKVTKGMIKNKRALSPVIATVILISVTIVVAVAVAYWMGSIAGGYTSFEQIEMPSIYGKAITTTPFDGWNITIELRNTGSADATIGNLFINGKPLKDYSSLSAKLYSYVSGVETDVTSLLYTNGVHVTRGNSVTLVLQLPINSVEGFTAGTRVDLRVHTAAGQDYPGQVRLP